MDTEIFMDTDYSIPDYRKISFYAKWLKTFSPQMTDEQYRQYIDGAFLWHAFSFQLIPKESFLEGDAARAAFDSADKSGAEFIRLWSDENPRPLGRDLKAADIENDDKDIEFYAVGKGFGWTYVVTHETGCGLGPYFMYSHAQRNKA